MCVLCCPNSKFFLLLLLVPDERRCCSLFSLLNIRWLQFNGHVYLLKLSIWYGPHARINCNLLYLCVAWKLIEMMQSSTWKYGYVRPLGLPSSEACISAFSLLIEADSCWQSMLKSWWALSQSRWRLTLDIVIVTHHVRMRGKINVSYYSLSLSHSFYILHSWKFRTLNRHPQHKQIKWFSIKKRLDLIKQY